MIQSALLDWIILSFTFSGLIAWRRRPESRFGPLMIAGGLATVVSSVSSVDTALTQTIGQAFDLVPFAVFLHVFLAFPSGALRSRGERALVAATYIVAVGLQLLILVLSGFDPNNSFALIDAPELAADIYRWQLTLLAAPPARRHRRADRAADPRGPPRPAARRLADQLVLARPGDERSGTADGRLGRGVAFVPPDSARHVRRRRALGDRLPARPARRPSGASIGRRPPDRPARRAAARRPRSAPLARALHDPTLELGYLAAGVRELGRSGRARAGAAGRRRSGPLDDPDRSRGRRIWRRSSTTPRSTTSPSCCTRSAPPRRSRSRTQRLQVELKAKLQELEGSRGRVIEAGQQERKRLERNLHDGAQQRLIALSLELGRLEGSLGDDPEARATDRGCARAEIAVSLEELRDVARGLHPAVLSGHGLAVALQSLVSSAPVPVALEVDVGERLEESVEVAAYYVVNESLANIGKHAEAASARVVVTRVGTRTGGRDHRRRRRRRRHREGLRPARAGRPGRGAGRAASRLDAQRRRHPGQGGDAVRVAIAEDSVLLREGLARLLEDNGFEVVAQCEDADALLRKLTSHELDVVDPRHPAAADPHRRGPARGDPDPRGAPRDRRARALPVRRARRWR